MHRPVLAALGLATALGLAACQDHDRDPYVVPGGDPCATMTCRVTGAAVKVTVPLHGGKPKLSLAPINTPEERR